MQIGWFVEASWEIKRHLEMYLRQCKANATVLKTTNPLPTFYRPNWKQPGVSFASSPIPFNFYSTVLQNFKIFIEFLKSQYVSWILTIAFWNSMQIEQLCHSRRLTQLKRLSKLFEFEKESSISKLCVDCPTLIIIYFMT